MKSLPLLIMLSAGVLSCTMSRVVPAYNSMSTRANIESTGNASPVTIFLLERDIPQEIERLGVVLILPNGKGYKIDSIVKKELEKRCQELGANGAYRLSEGYYPSTGEIPYLVFKYKNRP